MKKAIFIHPTAILGSLESLDENSFVNNKS